MENYHTKKSNRRELLTELNKKNKVLVEFYHSYAPLEDSMGKMKDTFSLLGQGVDFPVEKAINMILIEANNMNKVFSKISKSIVNAH